MYNTIDPNCTRCTLHTTRTQVVQPTLPDGMRVLFIGRDPGAIEDAEGTPFHPDAPAGKMLRRTIADVGIPIEWCGFDNTVSCHTPGNRGPHLEELQACRTWRRKVVGVGRGEALSLIVLLGAEALEAQFNLQGYKQSKVKAGKGMYPLADWHGKVVMDGGIPSMAAYHPSAALRSNEMRRAFVGDMKAVATLLGVEPNHPPILWLENLPNYTTHDVLAVDVETVSLTDRTLLGIGIAYRVQEAVYGRWFSGDDIGIGIDVLRQHRGKLVFHNAKFDWDVINQAGYSIPTRQLDDIMLKAYVLRREQEVGSLGLKELALADLGYTWTTLSDMGQVPSDLTDEELGQYCLYDCAATLYLNELYDRRLDE